MVAFNGYRGDDLLTQKNTIRCKKYFSQRKMVAFKLNLVLLYYLSVEHGFLVLKTLK